MNQAQKNTVVIIQARMSSTRLPGKVLKDLNGSPMLTHVVQRACSADSVKKVIVATTDHHSDDAIANLCKINNFPCFRGNHNDVLDRYYRCAQQFHADIVVRITADCPIIDPDIIDRTVTGYLNSNPRADYASNTIERTYPRGLDVEVMSFASLEKAWKEDDNPALREHVTPYIYRHPELFHIHSVLNDVDLSSFRWTVDTPEDMVVIERVYSHFQDNKFSWTQVLDLFHANPDWQKINEAVRQKRI